MDSRDSTSPISLYSETGRLIRDTRKTKGITQGRLAATVGLSRTSITNIERGRQKLLLHTLSNIAEALGVEIHDLLPRRMPMKSRLETQLPKDTSPGLRKLISKMVEKGSVAS